LGSVENTFIRCHRIRLAIIQHSQIVGAISAKPSCTFWLCQNCVP